MSLLGGQIWAQAAEYTHYLMTNRLPGRANRGHPLIRSPYGIFKTKDGWLGLVGISHDSIDGFLAAIGRPDALIDERIHELRVSATSLMWFKALVADAFRQFTTTELCNMLESEKIRYAPIWNYADVERDPGVWGNGYLTEIKDDDGNKRRVVGSPIRLSRTPLSPGVIPPSLGEHNEDVLGNLGLTPMEIKSLQQQNIV